MITQQELQKLTNILLKILDIHKIEKKNSIGISVFGFENKEKHTIYVSKKSCEEKHLINRRRRKRYYVLIKDFNTSMYDHKLRNRKKIFFSLFFTSF